jgi:hypothetical protein
MTKTDGTASVTWTLGSSDVVQKLSVNAYNCENTASPLQGSPLTFTATAEKKCQILEYVNILNGYEWDITPHDPVRPWVKYSNNVLRQVGNNPGNRYDYTLTCEQNVTYISKVFHSASGNTALWWKMEIIDLTKDNLKVKDVATGIEETWKSF